jgi:hypothetical protein
MSADLREAVTGRAKTGDGLVCYPMCRMATMVFVGPAEPVHQSRGVRRTAAPVWGASMTWLLPTYMPT